MRTHFHLPLNTIPYNINEPGLIPSLLECFKNVMIIGGYNSQNNIQIQYKTLANSHLCILTFDPSPSVWVRGAAASNVTSCAGTGHRRSLAKTQAAFPQARHHRSDYYLHCVSALIRIPICFLSSPHNTVHDQHVRSTVQLCFTLKHSRASPFHNKKTGQRSGKHFNSDS